MMHWRSESGEILNKLGAGDFFGEIGILNLAGGFNRSVLRYYYDSLYVYIYMKQKTRLYLSVSVSRHIACGLPPMMVWYFEGQQPWLAIDSVL